MTGVESSMIDLLKAPRLERVTENYFSYFSTKTYVVGTQKNCSFEHPKHIFKRMDKKILTSFLKMFDYLNLWF